MSASFEVGRDRSGGREGATGVSRAVPTRIGVEQTYTLIGALAA